MIPHTAITVPIVLFGLFLHWYADWPAFLAATFLTGLWYSREQYWEELKMRKGTKPLYVHIPLSMILVFRPMYRNLDFFAPVATAWLLTMGYVGYFNGWEIW